MVLQPYFSEVLVYSWYTQRIQSMLNEGRLEEGINDTIITLISTTRQASRLDEFRLISLCNVMSKLISKVPANRVKFILNEVVSEYHSAFIPGRMISNNFLLAHELAQCIKLRRNQKTGFCL